MAALSCSSLEVFRHFPLLRSPAPCNSSHSCKTRDFRVNQLILRSFPARTSNREHTTNAHIAYSVRTGSNSMAEAHGTEKLVWIWTRNKEVMLAAVDRGWSTFIFEPNCQELAKDWEWICDAYFQVIPAENIVAAFHGTNKNVFAVAKTPEEARISLEALEQGLDGVVLKVEDAAAVLQLKDYCNRKNELESCLSLTKATVTQVRMSGMGDRVCVDLCSLMRPGEGLLVGSFSRGLFLVHSECLESNYIASRPFRVNAGPVHSYVAVPGGKTCYLSELKAGKEVTVVDQNGRQRAEIVGRVKIETRHLIIVEAKVSASDQDSYVILLQNAETVALVSASQKDGSHGTAIPVTSLKVGDEIILRKQGGARHTGIEINEFVLEK